MLRPNPECVLQRLAIRAEPREKQARYGPNILPFFQGASLCNM